MNGRISIVYDRVYVMYLGVHEETGKEAYKIGYTWNVRERKDEFLISNPNIKVMIALAVSKAKEIEKGLHEKYANKKLYGEIFFLTEADLEHIYNYLLSIATDYYVCEVCGDKHSCPI